jgi:hypothetical protein
LPISSINDWTACLCDENNRKEDNVQEELLILLVRFNCSRRELSKYKNANKAMASKLVAMMLQDIFPNNKDSKSIEYCIQWCPTLALFVSLPPSLASKRSKSIFNMRGAKPTCILAVIYYLAKDNFSQILWMGTTVEAPPPKSKNVTWHSLGLGSFLVAALLKQHFCSGLPESTLSVQASRENKESLYFYKKLGFTEYETPDNGFTMLPNDFKTAIAANPFFWIDCDEPGSMVYLQLNNGKIHLWEDTFVDLFGSNEEDNAQHMYCENSGYA